MSPCEESAEERKEQVMVTVLDTIQNLGSFVENVALNPKDATPESVAALPKVANAICSLVNVAYENELL